MEWYGLMEMGIVGWESELMMREKQNRRESRPL